MSLQLAIVSMLRNADAVLDSFITYHLAIGFTRLFLFFDNPRDPSIRQALKYPGVTVIRNDEKLQQLWRKTRLYTTRPEYRQFLDCQLRPRQLLNVEIGIQLALREKIDWLLHIDLDELFYLPHGTVQQHFQALTERGVRHVVYHNYESITETSEVNDYFREVTLFKRPLPNPQQAHQRAQTNRIIKSLPAFADNYFLYYDIGKSAARPVHGLLPDSPHSFIFPDQQALALTDPNLEHNLLKRATTQEILSEDGIILHYPCCGFEHFWRKYNALGKFPDKWLGKIPIAQLLPFHVESRDIVMLRDKQAAREFYERHVVVKDEAAKQRLLAEGLACHVCEPARLLAEGAHANARAGRPQLVAM